MKNLILKLKVKDNIHAFKILQHLRLVYKAGIDEADFEGFKYKFNKTNKHVKHFLKKEKFDN